MATPKLRCIFCNSSYHNYRNCPLAYKKNAQKTVDAQAQQEYTGETPNVFVGKYGYPSVNVGLLNTQEYADHDDPLKWSRENYEIPKIVDLRTQMINARHGLNVKSPSLQPPSGFSNRFLEIAKEVGLAKKQVDVEIGLSKKPKFKTTFSNYSAPHGPNVSIEKARVASNPKTNHKLEKASSDTDLKATDAVGELFRKGIDEHTLVRSLSVGNFGIGRNRKLVPTRWSITAVDDTISKQLIQEIKNYSEGDCTLYIGGHLGNYYALLFFDDLWQYELYEQFVPQNNPQYVVVPEHDYESYAGRKNYAEETAGGYYATRIAILEELQAKKRQASVLAIRVITEEYTTPLGVWVVREAVRKTLSQKPLRFTDRKEMIKYAKEYIKKEFNYNISTILKDSILLKNITSQTKLSQF